jgi:asparagine synthetase B (glutamine-hydrolysing)
LYKWLSFLRSTTLTPRLCSYFQDGRCTEISYAKFESKSKSVTSEKVAYDLHEIVSSTVKTLVSNHSRISITLSGGYDSRYLLALIFAVSKSSIESCASVAYTEEEDKIACQVVKTLGTSINNFPVSGSIWDLYDQVHHFTSDGFPISKFVTILAQHYQGSVNGFMVIL